MAESEIRETDSARTGGHDMFRLWARTFKDNHMLQDVCIEDGSSDTRTHKVFHTLDELCRALIGGTRRCSFRRTMRRWMR